MESPKMGSNFQSRIRRRFYYGNDLANFNAPSLPLTEASVEYFQDCVPGPEGLGRLDMPMAATVSKHNKSVSPCSVVMSMLYAKRLKQRSKQYLQSMSSTDVFFISMMMASKYLYDEGVDEEVLNDDWADRVGQDVDDVNQMEMDFLKEMDWHLFVKPDEFDQALTALERRLALKEGMKRGWFTYTELAVLLDWDPVYDLWNQVGLDCTKMVSLLSAVYVASLASMMGSAAIALQLSGPMVTATLAMLSFPASQFMGNTPAAFLYPFVSSGVKSSAIVNNLNTSSLVQSRLSESSILLLETEDMELSEREQNHSNVAKKEMSPSIHRRNCQTAERDTVPVLKANGIASELHTEDKKEPGQDVEENIGVSKTKCASVLSLWLLDSLLTQVWSVFGHQEKPDSNAIEHTASNPVQQQVSAFHSKGKLEAARKRLNIHKNKGKDHGTKCKHCQARKAQSKPQSTQSSFRVSVGDEFRTDRLSQENGRAGNVILGVQFDELQFPSSENNQKNFQDRTQPLGSLECDQCFFKDNESNHVMLNGALSCSSLPRGRKKSDGHTDPSPHVYPNKLHTNSNLILPMSLMAEVPILDPIGFFTKNAGPVYALST